ncbi:hypothetical protein NMG60_11001091 [Bertholletia excelsa]
MKTYWLEGTKPMIETSIFDLPNGILYEILARLPMKTIRDCRFVCKQLREIISDTDFVNLLLSRSPSTLMLSSIYNSEIYFVEPESLDPFVVDGDHNVDTIVSPNSLLKLDPEFDLPSCRWDVLGSCNGLICFWNPRTNGPYHIYNPVMNEYMIVPQAEKYCFAPAGSGFGFCPETNQYAVLRLLYPAPRFGVPGVLKLEAEIITVGTNLWRKLGAVPCSLHLPSSGCFLNGAFHWIVPDIHNRFEYFCCFDFRNELFHPFPGPSLSVDDHNMTVYSVDVVLLGNCLSIYFRSIYDTDRLDIWVMKNYGIKGSWTKEFVIQLPLLTDVFHQNIQPIMSLNNGEILILQASCLLLFYSSKDKRFREVRINGVSNVLLAMAYNPTSVSITTAVIDDNILNWGNVYKATRFGEMRTYTRSKIRNERGFSSTRAEKKQAPSFSAKARSFEEEEELVDLEEEDTENGSEDKVGYVSNDYEKYNDK